MRNIWIIAKREFDHYFISPIAYVVAFMILLTTGIIFAINIYYFIQNALQSFGQVPDISPITGAFGFLLVLSIPAVTMRTLADEARRDALLDGSWFGDGLRVAVFFALIYTAARLVGVRHRPAVLAAVPLALLASWLGPWIAARQTQVAVGSFHSVGAAATAIGTAAFLAFGVASFRDAVATRGELGRFLLWALPVSIAWLVYGAYDFRLLAPAWPPLLALVVLSALPAATAVARRGALMVAVPFALFAVVVASNVYNIDGLQKSGWDQLRRTDDWLDPNETRAIVLPALTRALVVVRRELKPGDLLISPEGAFRFYFPGRVEQSFPNNCNDLHRFRVFVLTTDEGSKRYMEDFLHVSGDPSYWASCSEPRLKQLTDGSEGYAVFRVES